MAASEHERYMARALELAAFARGRTSPNPMVGAVIVHGGRVVGEGYHHQAGTPHAEIHALRAASDQASGATLYVNLEPCSHYGRTPPCTEALITAGLAEVHMAMLDPNPLVNGQGRARLEEAGIRTVVGECEAEARELNEAFCLYISAGRPFVIAKFAASLDGKIATRTGESHWITGEPARRWVHELRDTVDAILIGVSTVIADDPLLTTRLPGRDVRHPLRVVLDSRGRIPRSARILSSGLPGKTLLATTSACPAEHQAALEGSGVEILTLPADDNGRVSLHALLAALGRRQVMSLLVEGGGTVLDAFLRAHLADKVVAFLAPLLIGGQNAPGAVSGDGVVHLSAATRLERVHVERVGEDLLVVGYPGWRDQDGTGC